MCKLNFLKFYSSYFKRFVLIVSTLRETFNLSSLFFLVCCFQHKAIIKVARFILKRFLIITYILDKKNNTNPMLNFYSSYFRRFVLIVSTLRETFNLSSLFFLVCCFQHKAIIKVAAFFIKAFSHNNLYIR